MTAIAASCDHKFKKSGTKHSAMQSPRIQGENEQCKTHVTDSMGFHNISSGSSSGGGSSSSNRRSSSTSRSRSIGWHHLLFQSCSSVESRNDGSPGPLPGLFWAFSGSLVGLFWNPRGPYCKRFMKQTCSTCCRTSNLNPTRPKRPKRPKLPSSYGDSD